MQRGNYPGRVIHWPAAANPGGGGLPAALYYGLAGQVNDIVQQTVSSGGWGWLYQVRIAAAGLIDYSCRQFGSTDVYSQRQIIIF
jgi:hypothetical protein